jgi:tetratricopeptide (TPR) repeat protein
MGLAYYSMDNFDDALIYFQKAEAEEDWVGSGREVVYLLIGNAYVRKDSQTQNFADLQTVEENYKLALEVNPDYGRAIIGKANVLYLQASQDKNNCDLSGLEHASVLLDQALALKDQPSSANLETKVHFYRGQIALLRDACHQTDLDWQTKAQNEFTWVVDQYEKRKQSSSDYENQRSLASYFNLRAPCEAQLCDFESLQSLASHSYARLGYIAYKRNDADGALGWLKKSVETASPYYQGFYTSMMGDIYAATGKREQAIESYNDAIAIAEQNADAASLKTYQAKLSALK